jgi:hypothetical protein
MWKRRVTDLVFALALFVALTNRYGGHDRTVIERNMTVLRTSVEMVGVIILPPARVAFSPRALAGIVFIFTLVMGLLGLDLYHSKKRTECTL